MSSSQPENSSASPKIGVDLIDDPLQNKGTAFSLQERRDSGLLGLLPATVESLEDQVARAYQAFCQECDGLQKHIYLRQLQDENEVLFYRLLLEHTAEMMPIVYTPVVGLACRKFSQIYRRPRGVFISYSERDSIDEILTNVDRQIDVIVVTDGERILGLGDQGAGGMGIPIGKLSLYSLCGGIHPARTLPIVLDVGTNNEERLKDPRYIGWRHERVQGQQYDDFVEQFVAAVERRFPEILLQWEDFASRNAERLLKRYRDRLCTFNDDIQGTAAVTTGTILAAIESVDGKLCDQRFVMLGAGSAGVGISEQLIRTMVSEGSSEAAARKRFFLVNSRGLLHSARTDLDELHLRLAQSPEDLTGWNCDFGQPVSFEEVVHHAQPTVLVGATGQTGAFTESVVREMAEHAERPIIFPLSNPTSRAEAIPADLLRWTDGRAVVATGSPFDPVEFGGTTYTIPQCNNSYIFPAMGLGVLAASARRVTDTMFMAAATALKEMSPALADQSAPLLPSLGDVRQFTRHIAVAIAKQAATDGVADSLSDQVLQQRIDEVMWMPAYSPVASST